MNINSQELLLINRNRKFLNNQNPQPTPSEEAPVSKPEGMMSALDLQGQNNIAFQGVKVPAKASSALKKMMLATLLAGGLLSQKSCTPFNEPNQIEINLPDVTVENNIEITIDMGDYTALLQSLLDQQKITNEQLIEMNSQIAKLYELILAGQMSAEEFYTKVADILGSIDEKLGAVCLEMANQTRLLSQLVEIGTLTKEEAAKINAQIAELYKLVLSGQISAEEFYAKMIELMTTNNEYQQAIHDQLVDNGLSQEQANAYLEKILKEIQDGKISAEVAYGKLMEVLQGLGASLSEIKDLIKLTLEQNIISNEKADKMNETLSNFYMAYLEGKTSAEEFYKQVVDYMIQDSENQKMILDQLVKNGVSQEQANAYLEKILQEVRDGKLSAEQAFAKLVTILDAINCNLSDIRDLIKLNLEQNMISNEKADKMNETLTNFYMAYLEGQVSAEQFYKQVFDYMVKDNENQKMIYNQLVNNGMSQQEANAYLEKLLQEVKDGKVSAQEAMAKLTEILGNIEASLANIEAMMTSWTDIFKNLLEQQVITAQQSVEINSAIAKLYSLVESGQITAGEFYKQMLEFMANNEVSNKLIIDQLIVNGMSQEQANAYLEKILKEVQDGKLSAQEALNQLTEILKNIDGTLQNILAELKAISEKITENHAQYMDAKAQELDMLGKLYYQGKIDQSYLEDLYQNSNKMNSYLSKIEGNTTEILNALNDDAKYNKFMADLKAMMPGDVDYQKFEDMFKMLGLSINEAMDMSRKDLLGAINEFQNTYLKTEAEQTGELKEINEKLDVILAFPGFDTTGLQDALAELTTAVNNGRYDVTTELKNIQGQLDAIYKLLDAMYKELGTLSSEVSTYNKIFKQNWEEALAKLDNIGNDLSALKGAQYQANAFLSALIEKVDELKAQIAELEAAGKGGMTIDEFKAYMNERDVKNFEKFVKVMEDLGLDKLAGDVQTIKDLLSAIDKKMDNQKGYSAQLDRIIAILEANPNYKDDLDEIKKLIQEWKCDCQCGKDSGSTDESIKDMEDMFS